MDTPEADISAIQAGRIPRLPAYQEHDIGNNDSEPMISTVDPLDTRHVPPSYDQKTQAEAESGNRSHEPESVSSHDADSTGGEEENELVNGDVDGEWENPEDIEAAAREQARLNTINGFFEAITNGHGDAVALFINRGLVTANTTTDEGKTPLLAAVETKNIGLVQQLLDAGAEPDAFGVVAKNIAWESGRYIDIEVKRTPLQLAASVGHLPLVKLFMERYNCNDAAVAPDGQIALRLASSNGHREVVEYLPSRRVGGFLRWKTAHQKALRRIKSAFRGIYKFFKFFLFDIEKFFLWTCPKHIIVKPLEKSCKWAWENRKGFGSWCKTQVKKTPERIAKVGKGIWRGVKKVPKAISETAKFIWKFLTVDLPKLIKWLGRYTWSLLTVRIPKVIAIVAKWMWKGVTSTAKAIGEVLLKIASLLHTFFSAIITYFKELTLQDIMNGVGAVFHSIFVTFPATLWRWIEKFGDVSYKIMKGLFSTIGVIIWCLITMIGYAIFWTVTYLPVKIFEILLGIGESLGKGLREFWLFFSPKS